ncbi:MAG: SAM-HAT-N domain-containing protein [Candidatus Midichloria mitochondrii]|uniref:S-adenosyl-l-methionine hydroxide adenosyltransferase N-terminal domain-containing protein n=1 Tax=Midichloria mitochondrii (strain IricVA) TaxID=696127 RepID=F7XWT3_MIDMI|nr:SAM-dependent chlorinase/fluorinase [Candidatus Midichloria mitochondrii]AEI89132.1 hypothetical protein midi_00844 [Candidatus Midichloria mitochondrii IricVA]MDJ1256335.1 SAM-dependent chlorinase/fluorinase [Candidatus Midichloria mitochondrii]MDJ1288027.1 SAM-dependent chlorinase/fluorinase [Candidatus Midichloria mitochondrii]MDJ1298878.1 SAM-dependent chlorinase/fluorinase [Candidatus Midichloria mitochondrii]MDJ1313080.1 SAM-dependent chlorinase/fluorinase [Candidatus Midichloria mito
MRIFKRSLITISYILLTLDLAHAKSPAVLMTDFETIDGAVSAMKGAIYSVDQKYNTIFDLTHKIEPF